MEIVIKGEAKEIATLVLAVQERQKVSKPPTPKNERESIIEALENRLYKLKHLPSCSPTDLL